MVRAGRAVEMAGLWKDRKSTSSFPSLPTAPWKSRKRREIPTFPQPGIAPDGKVENQNQVSHFPTRGSQRPLVFPYLQDRNTRKQLGRFAASFASFFRIMLYWKRTAFRIIVGLEMLGGGQARASESCGITAPRHPAPRGGRVVHALFRPSCNPCQTARTLLSLVAAKARGALHPPLH
jgi:hypothetical protein